MMVTRLIIFLVLNFVALGLGGWLMGEGAFSAWYQGLLKASWTPPGWVFGVAWTTVMVCFALYMSVAYRQVARRKWLLGLFAVQWVLNVSWNPVFFALHEVLAALIVIGLLTALLAMLCIWNAPILRWQSLWLAPYVLWLCIATSLNAYIWWYN